ncbi:MAG: DeoR/GlpR transcriptional regulator [Sebaldella sp.]|nr:DeoR/GlpR transcriptional regulator [Sebaldella sp.]
MFVKERLDIILKLLNENGKIEVNALSRQFNVSKDLIRKDLQKLEDQGLLERTYGGAVPKRAIAKNLSVWSRLSSNIEEKKKIAKKAVTLINPNETIFLDITSINYFLADEILKKDISITVITNMIDVMHLLYHSNNIKLIGIGGTLNKELDGFVGSVSIDQIKKYKSDKAFIGVVGIDTVSGSLTTFDSEDGLTKEAIINSAKKRYLITERQKTFQDGNFIYSNIDEFDGIISDDIPKDIKTSIKKKGLNII